MKQSKFYQIKNITEHEYTLVSCDGSVITLPIQEVDKTASAFTIQDAKDGDVLYNKDNFAGNSVFIYKGISDKTHAYLYYTRLFKDKDFSIYNDVMWKNGVGVYGGEFYPATKERCDLLFQKMKEAGYEWDSEKKELKIGDWCIDNEDKKMLDFAIRAVGLCKQYAINHQVNGYSKLPDVPKRYEELQDWLKSLRPQNRWKPSEEMLEALYRLIPENTMEKSEDEMFLDKFIKA